MDHDTHPAGATLLNLTDHLKPGELCIRVSNRDLPSRNTLICETYRHCAMFLVYNYIRAVLLDISPFSLHSENRNLGELLWLSLWQC
jgi:hypothetical protein